MAFPGRRTGALQPSSPILVTATGSVPVPAAARVMHAFIVGGGGSGGAGVNAVGSNASAGGGGAGGSLYVRVDLRLWQGELPLRSSIASPVSLTIGSGGAAVSTTSGGVTGNTGGTTTLALAGGLSIAIPGGAGGVGSFGINALGGQPGQSATTYSVTRINPTDAVIVKTLSAIPMASASDGFTGDSTGAAGGNASQPASNGGAIASTVLLPWWVQSVGLTRGSGGTGATDASLKNGGGGAGGFVGNGGNGAASNTAGATATAGTGYGSGGGGAASTNSTSGAGAPGCAVLMFELEV